MKTFALHLQSTNQYDRIDAVVSFVGEDESGSFGLQAGHERFMTPLVFGLARFRTSDDSLQFLAVPGGLLYFVNNELFVNTRRYLLDNDYERISQAITEELLAEEENLRCAKESLGRMEEGVLRRMWQMRRHGRQV